MSVIPAANREAVPVIDRLGAGSSDVVEAGDALTGAAAQITPTIAAVAGRTGFCTGFSVDGLGATAASVIEVTLAGLVGGTKRYKLSIPAGATTAISRLVVEFSRPIPATAVNTAIVLTVPSFGAGNTSVVAEVHGFTV